MVNDCINFLEISLTSILIAMRYIQLIRRKFAATQLLSKERCVMRTSGFTAFDASPVSNVRLLPLHHYFHLYVCMFQCSLFIYR